MQEVINPYTREPTARVCLATAADIEVALASAEQAQKSWGRILASEREAILCRAAEIIERRRMEIAKVLIEEGGKSPIVILADADLDYAVRSAAFGIYFNQGQCAWPTRESSSRRLSMSASARSSSINRVL